MGSNGIRDRVAIVGMGCTNFGERWDLSAEDMLGDAATMAMDSAQIPQEKIDAYWLGTMASGLSGVTLSRPLKLDYKPVTRVDRGTKVEEFSRESHAIGVDRRKQRQRHFGCTDLRFCDFEPATELQASLGVRAGNRCCAQPGDRDRAQQSNLKNALAVQRDPSPVRFLVAKYLAAKMARRLPAAPG